MVRKFLTPTLLLAVLGVLFPVCAFANTGLSIQPIKIDETLSVGQSFTGQVLLQNASDGPVNVEVTIDDFVPNAGADSIQFVGRAPGVTTVRDWINIQTKSPFSLKIGEQKEIPYTITAPPNAEPGGHFGVLLFKATPVGTTTGSLKVGTQVGMIVLIAIPGSHLEKGNIVGFTAPQFLQHGPVPFSIDFQNTGTVHFEPKGSIVITNMFGQKAGEVPITGQVVLPTSVRKLSFSWDTNTFSIGRYSAVATLYDGDGNTLTSQTLSFWILPVWYLFGFLLTLVVVYFVIRYLRRHLRISVVK
jgi:hypothetical protein